MTFRTLNAFLCASFLLTAFTARAGVPVDGQLCKTDPGKVMHEMIQNGIPLMNIQSIGPLGDQLLKVPVEDAAGMLRDASPEKMAPYRSIPIAKLIQVIGIYEVAAQHVDFRNMNPKDQTAMQLSMVLLVSNLNLAKEALLVAEAQLSDDPKKAAEIEPLITAAVQDLTEFKKSYRETKTQLALAQISLTRKEQARAAQVTEQVSKAVNIEICEKAVETFTQH